MLIGEASYSVMFFGALIVALIALGFVIVLIDSRWRNQEVPKARLVTRGDAPGVVSAKARPLVRAAAALGALVGSACALWWLHYHHVDVVIVNERGSAIHHVRYVALGAPRELPLAHGIRLNDDTFTNGDVWIFNETERAVRLEDSEYGPIGFPSFKRPEVIPAGTMEHARRVDFIGPDDVPPNEITVSEGETIATRTWLTWDR